MKPSWDIAPKWANWLAKDSDAAWWWYSKKPDLLDNVWDCDGGISSPVIPPGCDGWKDSLEERPK